MCLAVPMKIIKIDGACATVGAEGVKKSISIVLLDGLKTGDYVMVHAGFAIEKVDTKRAEETLGLLNEIRRRVSE